MMRTDRIAYLDNIKGFLIILVVVGHIIQDAVVNGGVLNRYIMSFHMPLFMAVSGFCSYKEDLNWNTIAKRARQLLIPFLVWAVVKSLIVQDITYVWTIVQYPDRGLWFLYALFFIVAIVVCCDKLSKKVGDEKVCMIASFLFWMLLTVVVVLLNVKCFGLQFIAWQMPFFIMGFLMRKYRIVEDKRFDVVAIVSLFVWCVLAYWCSEEIFVSCNHFVFRLYEFIVAVFAILGWLGLFHKAVSQYVFGLTYLGKKTLGIYSITLTMQFLVFLLVRPYTSQLPYMMGIILLTALLICFALALEWILNKNRYTRLLFLGK